MIYIEHDFYKFKSINKILIMFNIFEARLVKYCLSYSSTTLNDTFII